MNHSLVVQFVFILVLLYGGFTHTVSEWVKLNDIGSQVCFEGKGDKPGVFPSIINGFVAAVKLVHKSGEISCIGAPKYNSFFGCNAYSPVEDYPLNTVVTNSDNKIKFPTIGFIPRPGENPAFWFGLDDVNSRSKEIVLQRSFSTPYYVNKGQVLKVWYGEDLFNTYEDDTVGRVCVDVYGHLI